MQRFKRVAVFSVFALATLVFPGCRGLSAELPTLSEVITLPTPDTQAIIDDVVATVSARPAVSTQAPANIQTGLGGMDAGLEATLVELYRKTNPAVVHIFVRNDLGRIEGTGSGFVVDEDGHIITNNHVVQGADALEVAFANGERRQAETIGLDVDSDLAVIKVESLPPGVSPIPLGDSNAVAVGQFVVAIGNPFAEAGSMSIGIVSGLGRTLSSQRIAEGGGFYSLPRVIQTDAAINPGNSGGPLLNLQGEVIGVNSAIRTDTGANSGVGFSIPVNAVRRITPALIAEGHYRYPFLGIRMTDLDLLLKDRLGLATTSGAYVTGVTEGGPAEKAGIIAGGVGDQGEARSGGDLIIAINGTPVTGTDELISYLVFETEVGQTVTMTVIRNGSEIDIPLTLGERP
jgi:2-alkenal reductase